MLPPWGAEFWFALPTPDFELLDEAALLLGVEVVDVEPVEVVDPVELPVEALVDGVFVVVKPVLPVVELFAALAVVDMPLIRPTVNAPAAVVATTAAMVLRRRSRCGVRFPFMD